MEEGSLNENVDMAVSLNGRVLPFDNPADVGASAAQAQTQKG